MPIALGILAASGQIPLPALAGREFIGELGLNGELRSVPGTLPAAIACEASQRALFVPTSNADEAAMVKSATVYGINNLAELCAYLLGRIPLDSAVSTDQIDAQPYPDLADIRGQAQAKRALAIAAAGSHNLLLS